MCLSFHKFLSFLWTNRLSPTTPSLTYQNKPYFFPSLKSSSYHRFLSVCSVLLFPNRKRPPPFFFLFPLVLKYVTGKISDEERQDIVCNACPGPGACGGMYTANTMSSALESLGERQEEERAMRKKTTNKKRRKEWKRGKKGREGGRGRRERLMENDFFFVVRSLRWFWGSAGCRGEGGGRKKIHSCRSNERQRDDKEVDAANRSI